MTERGYVKELNADRHDDEVLMETTAIYEHPEWLRLAELYRSGEMTQELHLHDDSCVFMFRRSKIEAGQSVPGHLEPMQVDDDGIHRRRIYVTPFGLNRGTTPLPSSRTHRLRGAQC